MKKTFKLVDEKRSAERVADKIKFEVKKYIKRERRKELPEGSDFWDFDCRIGESAESAQAIHEKEINKKIDLLVSEKAESFYLEIMAKQARRNPRSKE
ncbi:DUF6172 family protein [Halobacteriovorax sp. XZX-3]|uniref:DUF6172 family protein n=1 Tax=unclassified Halobacteriovorax TaxID=2639665 RepID=UPI000CD22B96|nr:DUF6172 family protein [Halobacteriovorax sp. DA5]POB13530.1 hypothetical protein C0Z22_10215 [Halobacteriovorax sp. DA5]